MKRRQQIGRGRFIRGEQGTTFVMVTLFIIALFGFAALSIDVGNVFREQRRAHVATDSAAIAGVAQLGNPLVPVAVQKASAIAEARLLANTNGVTDAEIANGARNGYPGEIQVGIWTNNIFTANATPYNAVRVPARKTVDMYFGKAVGLGHMTPVVDSVAMVGAIAIPYGVPSNVVGNVGSTVTLQRWSPGNWGPLDLCGVLTGQQDTRDAINGPGCFSTIGTVTGVATGFDGVKQGFQDLYNNNPRVVLPVTESFPNGNHEVTIVDFIVVELLGPGSGGGNNWELDVLVLGRGFGALSAFGLGPARVLVE